MRKYKAALIGYYGFNNFGDELLLQASLNMLERAGINRSEIIILSNQPDNTENIFNIKAISRWSFKALIKTLINCERLIFGGGGIFQDSTSVKSCVWYWALIKLAKLLRVKVYALGQSIGPLKTRAGKFFAKNALKDLEILQFRDEPSLTLAANNFKLNNIISGYDLALSLDFQTSLCHCVTSPLTGATREAADISEGEYILLNLRPHRDLNKFINQAQDILQEFNNYNNNYKIIGVAFSPEDFDLLSKLDAINIYKLYKFYNISDINNNFASLFINAKFALGMRLHFNITAFKFNVKFHALCYDPKVEAFNNFALNNQAKDAKIFQFQFQNELDKIAYKIFN